MAQDDITLFGVIDDLVDHQPEKDAFVVEMRPSGTADTTWTDEDGTYEIHLDYDHLHDLRYGAPGKITKRIIIEAGATPDEEREGGHGMNVDMTLFTPVPGKDYSFLDQPFGRARYEPADTNLAWDMAMTDSMRAKLAPLLPDTSQGPAIASAPVQAAPRFGTTELALLIVVILLLLLPASGVALWWFFLRKRQ